MVAWTVWALAALGALCLVILGLGGLVIMCVEWAYRDRCPHIGCRGKAYVSRLVHVDGRTYKALICDGPEKHRWTEPPVGHGHARGASARERASTAHRN